MEFFCGVLIMNINFFLIVSKSEQILLRKEIGEHSICDYMHLCSSKDPVHTI